MIWMSSTEFMVADRRARFEAEARRHRQRRLARMVPARQAERTARA